MNEGVGVVIRLILRRAVALIPVLAGISLTTFLIVGWLPGNTASQLLGPDATPEQLATLEAKLGLDAPAVTRYIDWLHGVLTGDLGRSLASDAPIAGQMASRIPVTFELVVGAFLIAIFCSISVAVACEASSSKTVRASLSFLCATTVALPGYIVGFLLVWLLAVQLGLLPSMGYVPVQEGVLEHLRRMILPMLSIAIPLIGIYARFLIADIRQQKARLYVLAARSRGIGPGRLLLRHALPNSLTGLTAIVGASFGGILGGTVVIEQIFGLPGLGQMIVDAVNSRDIHAVQGVVLLLAASTVFASTVADLTQFLLDARVRSHAGA